jgi:diacylglycerol kinase family enzyme
LTSSLPSASRRPPAVRSAATGQGLAILVNANAKRGGRRVAAQIARVLPGAEVKLTKSPREIDQWLRTLPSMRGIFAAGGDGTAVALVNAVARVVPEPAPLPVLGVLPLGTGNAWAHSLGAPKLYRCLQMLADWSGDLPARDFGLLEVEGSLTHFAGSGWDAMVLDDYKQQLAGAHGPGRRLSRSVYGYVLAALVRTTPKVVLFGNPHLVVENLGEKVYVVDREGRPQLLTDAGPGTILYDGPAGAASAGTCAEYGYRFRAFPFAERMPGFINVRVYARRLVEAVTSIPRMWRGEHPIEGMHDFLATSVRMTFSRPVALQIAGDAHGSRSVVEYHAARRTVPMVEWRRLA